MFSLHPAVIQPYQSELSRRAEHPARSVQPVPHLVILSDGALRQGCS